jgi:hypothetical protein
VFVELFLLFWSVICGFRVFYLQASGFTSATAPALLYLPTYIHVGVLASHFFSVAKKSNQKTPPL